MNQNDDSGAPAPTDIFYQIPPTGPEPGPGRVPWSALDVFLILGLVIGSNFASIWFAGLLLSFSSIAADPSDIVKSPLLTTAFLVVQWIMTLGPTFLYLKIKGYRFDAATLGFRRTAFWRAAGLLALVIFLTYVLGETIYTFIVEQIDPEFLPSQDITEEFSPTTLGFVLALIQVALVVPVLEELFFRGIIHQGLEQRWGFGAGAAVSSLIFALFHIEPNLYIPIFMLGFGFAFLVHKTGSLWPSIAGHFLVNFIGVVGQYFIQQNS